MTCHFGLNLWLRCLLLNPARIRREAACGKRPELKAGSSLAGLVSSQRKLIMCLNASVIQPDP